MIPRSVELFVLACAVGVVACAGSTPASPSNAAPRVGEGEPCSRYLAMICTELGRDSPACQDAYGTLALTSPRACAVGIEDFAVTRDRIAELRGVCDEVIARICNELGGSSQACIVVRREAPGIPPGHCEALRQDYAQLLAKLKRREAQFAPLDAAATANLVAGSPPGFGPPDAAFVVVEFSDFECPYCAQAAGTVSQIEERYGSRVRFVFRNYPLPFHAHARDAARAALAAHRQGKFWEYHGLLFANQGALARADLLAYAKRLSLDVAAFEAALDDPATDAAVDADIALGDRVGVAGTPTLFAGSDRIEDPYDFEAIAKLIDAALSE